MERPARELLESLEEDGDERVHILRRGLSRADRLAEVGVREADTNAEKEKRAWMRFMANIASEMAHGWSRKKMLASEAGGECECQK
jgi:hypothetical protein